jgi:hypothetical protein
MIFATSDGLTVDIAEDWSAVKVTGPRAALVEAYLMSGVDVPGPECSYVPATPANVNFVVAFLTGETPRPVQM